MDKKFITCADNPNKGYAFNVYMDDDDNIYIEHVWKNPCVIKITPEQEIIREEK